MRVKGLTGCKTVWDTFLPGLLELAQRYKTMVNIPQCEIMLRLEKRMRNHSNELLTITKFPMVFAILVMIIA